MAVLTLQKDIEYYKGESAAYATVPASFRAEMGGYNNTNARRWVGDIAEAIAFDRLLTEGERQTVENYLTEKWRGAAAHAHKGPAASWGESGAARRAGRSELADAFARALLPITNALPITCGCQTPFRSHHTHSCSVK